MFSSVCAGRLLSPERSELSKNPAEIRQPAVLLHTEGETLKNTHCEFNGEHVWCFLIFFRCKTVQIKQQQGKKMIDDR